MSDSIEQRDIKPANPPMHATLRAALVAAAQGMPALVAKGGWHDQKKFQHVRHEDVLEHTRNVLLAHGVAVLHGDLKFLQAVPARKDAVLFLWEQSIEAQLVGTGDKLEARVQVMTGPDDAAAAKASTAADRVFLMRLCRLAGGADHEEQRSRGGRREADEQGEVAPDPREQERATAEALKALAHVKLTEESLLHYCRVALGNLDAALATDAQRTRVYEAFEKRCKEARLDARKLVERATAPSDNRRNPKE